MTISRPSRGNTLRELAGHADDLLLGLVDDLLPGDGFERHVPEQRHALREQVAAG